MSQFNGQLPVITSPRSPHNTQPSNMFSKRYNSVCRAGPESPSLMNNVGIVGNQAQLNERRRPSLALGMSAQNNIPMKDMIDFALNKP